MIFKILLLVFSLSLNASMAKLENDSSLNMIYNQKQKDAKDLSNLIYQSIKKNKITISIDKSKVIKNYFDVFLQFDTLEINKRKYLIYFTHIDDDFLSYPLEKQFDILLALQKFFHPKYWENRFTLYALLDTKYKWSDKQKDLQEQIKILKFMIQNYEKYKSLLLYNKKDNFEHIQPDLAAEHIISLLIFDLEHESFKNKDELIKQFKALLKQLVDKTKKDIKYHNINNLVTVLALNELKGSHKEVQQLLDAKLKANKTEIFKVSMFNTHSKKKSKVEIFFRAKASIANKLLKIYKERGWSNSISWNKYIDKFSKGMKKEEIIEEVLKYYDISKSEVEIIYLNQW